MSVELQAFVLLCALGSVVFSAEAAVAFRQRMSLWWAAFLLLVLAMYPAAIGWSAPALFQIESGQAGMLMLLMAGASLRFDWPRITALFSAALATLWLGSLLAAGLPLLPAWLLAAGVPMSGMLLSAFHLRFSNPVMRQEARLLLLFASLGMTVVPAVIAGWRLRVDMQTASSAIPAQTEGGILLLFVALALVAGALYRLIMGRK